MKVFVVDTNVAIAANGRQTHADEPCQLACVERLRSIVAEEIVAIDDKHYILNEYLRYMSQAENSGVGDKFFEHVLTNSANCAWVREFQVTPSENEGQGFEELPENTFDRSDRKFLAVAVGAEKVGAEAVVLNATDSDWDEHAALMNDLGVNVSQLCPQHASKRK